MNRILPLCWLVFVLACEPSWSELEANARCRQLTGRDCDSDAGAVSDGGAGGTGGGGTGGGGTGGGSGGGLSGGGTGGGLSGGGTGGGAGGGLTGGGTGGGVTGGGTGGGVTGGGIGGGTGGGSIGGGTGGGTVGGGTGGGTGGGSIGGGTGGGTVGGGTGGSGDGGATGGGGGVMGGDGGCVHDGGVLWTRFFPISPNGAALRVAGFGDRLYWTEALSDGGTLLSMSTSPLGCTAPTAQFSVEIEGPITMLSAGDAGVMAASVVLGRKFTTNLQPGGLYSPGSPTRAVATGPTESATLNGQVGSTLSAIGLSNNSNLNVAYGSNCQFDTSPGAAALVSLGTTEIAAVYSTLAQCNVDSPAVLVDAGVIFTVSRSSTPGPSAYLAPARGIGTFAPAMVSTATGVYVAAQTSAGLRLFNINPASGPLFPTNNAISSTPVFARALLELPPDRLVLVGEYTGSVMFGTLPLTSTSGTQVYRAVLQQGGQTVSLRSVTGSAAGSNFAYGATIVGNQLVMALSCADATPPCPGLGVMLMSISPE